MFLKNEFLIPKFVNLSQLVETVILNLPSEASFRLVINLQKWPVHYFSVRLSMWVTST